MQKFFPTDKKPVNSFLIAIASIYVLGLVLMFAENMMSRFASVRPYIWKNAVILCNEAYATAQTPKDSAFVDEQRLAIGRPRWTGLPTCAEGSAKNASAGTRRP